MRQILLIFDDWRSINTALSVMQQANASLIKMLRTENFRPLSAPAPSIRTVLYPYHNSGTSFSPGTGNARYATDCKVCDVSTC